MDREQAKEKIGELVGRCQRLSQPEMRQYNEENTKKDFILPLFEALGWNVNDASEVAAEHGTGQGRVDYTFRIQGVSRFYLEAKPLRADLKDHPDWVKQAVSYAYSRSIPWVVLTNFRQLWLFTGDIEARRFITLTADQYLTDFSALGLLSRENVQGGELDREAQKLGIQPLRIPVEKRLFEQLRDWREVLFRQVHTYRSDLSLTIVDETIQRIFNRLVFIRTCEDRKLEDPVLEPMLRQHIAAHRRGQSLWEGLRRVFRQFDGYYDSELFQLHIADQVHIDDDVVEEIIKGLYHVPKTDLRYDFSGIDADILGRVYEQYLGHVAQLVTRRHQQMQRQLALGATPERAVEEVVEVVEKPQRRKAQGIYYTPKWVVEYIVRQTVGRFIEENSNRPDRIHEIRVLDPACGSGSFLIRAYDELLRWHAANAGMALKDLTHEYRMPILRNNVYGVDLDDKAVEIARLNLLLRALARRELLPSLADNIKRGNSLISGGEAELRPYFGEGWRDKHPFNWEQEFRKVMEEGGFDVVIGNPPYVGFQGFEEDKPYLRERFKSAIGRFDVYIPFIERGLQLLKEGGLLGFICPTNFMKRQHGQALRELLRLSCKVESIVDFEHSQVFEDALNYTCILIIRKVKPSPTATFEYFRGIDSPPITTAQTRLSSKGWVFLDPIQAKVVDRVRSQNCVPLGDLVEGIFEGVVTGQNAVFLLPKSEAQKLGLEEALLKPALQGRHVERYYLEE